MIVCVCNRLNEQRIRAACASGAAKPEDVYAHCGVKKNCGRCLETIAEIHSEEKQVAAALNKAA
jgi:bacterioferritin-associated ferredoxin